MIAKSITDITEGDLQHLVDSGVPESRHIEYKRALPDRNREGKIQFLKSVTAFANTLGGDLIYGIDAPEGIPQRLSPLSVSSKDEQLRYMESLCSTGVDHRLMGIQYHFVDIEAGGSVLVVRVLQSWNGPHRVTIDGHAHFYGRNAAGAYQLDVGQLRRAFGMAGSMADDIRSFRAERLIAISSDNTPVPIRDGPIAVLHVVPMQSFARDSSFDLSQPPQILAHFNPPGFREISSRFNLDGRVLFHAVGEDKSWAYTQIFRGGRIELAQSHAYAADRTLHPGQLEFQTVEALRSFIAAYRIIGVPPPAYLFLSLIHVAGYKFQVNMLQRIMGGVHSADRDIVALPEAIVEDWSLNPATFMRPVFDTLWNAFGYECSNSYDREGNWRPQQ